MMAPIIMNVTIFQAAPNMVEERVYTKEGSDTKKDTKIPLKIPFILKFVPLIRIPITIHVTKVDIKTVVAMPEANSKNKQLTIPAIAPEITPLIYFFI